MPSSSDGSGEVLLRTNSVELSGWQRVSVTRSIEDLSGTFELGYGERNPTDPLARPVARGDRARVEVGGETVIDGWVDAVEIAYKSDEHGIMVSGRDLAGDLIDCKAILPRGEMLRATALEIAQALAKPYGIKVRAEVDVGTRLAVFRADPGEKGGAAIARVCRFRGLLAVSDGAGGILLTRAENRRSPVELRLGENILEGSGRFDDRNRYSEITVLGQNPAALQAWGVSSSAKATDPTVTRFRPLELVADGPATVEELKDRAQLEVARRAAAGARITYTVKGWKAAGSLWTPGWRVPVRDDWLGISTELLLVSVQYSLSESQAELARLTLVRPESVDLTPIPETKSGAEFWETGDE